MRIAAIDVGSNSIHMVVAQLEADGRFSVLDRAKEMVRLGRKTLTRGRLSQEAMRSGIETLANFRTLAQRMGATRFKAVATSAVREASNGGDFIRQVGQQVGIRVKVIPGEEEARLVFLGVQHAIDLRGEPTLIVDAGGGSVELIHVENGKPVAIRSFKLGVARLTEEFITEDPPEPRQIAHLQEHLGAQMDEFLAELEQKGVRRVVGTSGTMLSLISMCGHLRGEPPNGHLNHFSVSAEEISRLRRSLVKSDREERLRMKGLDERRAELIVVGAVLADHILRKLDAKEIVACTWSLREGVLLDFIARHRKGIEEAGRFSEPRRRSVARFARHLGETGTHGEHVAALAVRLFDQFSPEMKLPAEAREWLEYAAILHDIGHHLSHDNHHRHSYYMIVNGELLGFRRDEIEIIAQTARYHQKAPPKSSDEGYQSLSPTDRQTVRALSALLRVADALDRSHYGVVIDAVVSTRDRKRLIQLMTDGKDAALELFEAERRVGLLERVLGAEIEFRVAGRTSTSKPRPQGRREAASHSARA